MFGLMRIIGVAGEGLGCFLASSSKIVDYLNGVERGRNEPQNCSVRNCMAALMFPWKTRGANIRELLAEGCNENAVDVARLCSLLQAERQYHLHTRDASNVQDT